MEKTIQRSSENLYSFLLWFYPKRYKQQFGEEMKFVFSESLHDSYSEQGLQGVFMLWVRTVIDGIQSFLVQHIENIKYMKGGGTMNTKKLMQYGAIRSALGTAGILAIPFLFRWDWTLSDFVIMGVILFVTGNLLNLAVTKGGKYKLVIAGVIAFLFLWLWAELAVGVFTNWGS